MVIISKSNTDRWPQSAIDIAKRELIKRGLKQKQIDLIYRKLEKYSAQNEMELKIASKTSIERLIDFFRIFKIREKAVIYYQNISIIGLFCFLLIYGEYGFENLLIPVYILVIVGITASFILTVLFFKFYKREMGLVWAFFHNLTLGLIVAYLFIQSNDSLSFNETKVNNYYIQRLELGYLKTHKSSFLIPAITVKINGVERQLVLNSYNHKEVQKTRHIWIGVKNGLWNYPIIKSIQLNNNEK